MHPAREALGTAHGAGAELRDDLVVGDDFALLERALELRHKREPCGVVFVARGVVGGDARPLTLRQVHGDVCGAK